jgi:hypothetical protein
MRGMPTPHTCATCVHARPSTTEEVRSHLSVRTDPEATNASMTMEHHPDIRNALATSSAWVFCGHHRSFCEGAYTCESFSPAKPASVFARVGDALARILGRRPAVAGVHVTPGTGVRVDSDAVPEVPRSETVCGFCGQEHDRCSACTTPRGLCGKCPQCGHGLDVRQRAGGVQFACSVCTFKGAGEDFPFPALLFPQEIDGKRYCDSCAGFVNDARRCQVPVERVMEAWHAYEQLSGAVRERTSWSAFVASRTAH